MNEEQQIVRLHFPTMEERLAYIRKCECEECQRYADKLEKEQDELDKHKDSEAP